MSVAISKLTTAPQAIANGWKKCWRKVYRPMGFTKGSEFFLFAIFGGNLLFFPCMNFKLLGDNTPAGGIFYFSTGYNAIGNKLHLIGVLFGYLLAFYQFIPVIGQKSPITAHIISSLATTLYLISQAGLLINIRKTAGGDSSAILALGLITFSSTTSLLIAYYNLLKGRNTLFREWRIRAWSWAGTIITLRLMIFGLSMVIKFHPSAPWYTTQSCSIIYHTYTALGLTGSSNPTVQIYPACVDGANSTAYVAVKAAFDTPEGMASVYNYGFAMVTWFAFVLHSAVLEVYFRKTAGRAVALDDCSAGVGGGRVVEEKTDGTSAVVTEVQSEISSVQATV